MNKKIQAVIFDLDGTLIDSMSLWDELDRNFLKRRNIEPPDDLFENMKSNGIADLAIYFKTRFSLNESIEDIIQEWVSEVNYAYSQKLKLRDGSEKLIKYLSTNNIKLAVGTSNELSLTKAVLSSNNVIDFFKTITTGCSGLKGKPEPDIYLKTAKDLKVKPEDCIVIEDSLHGVNAGKNAGMTVFAIKDKYSDFEKKEIQKNSDIYFNNYFEIYAYLNKNSLMIENV